MPRKSSSDSQTFGELEVQLAATLQPVRPEHTFVQNMRQRFVAAGPAIAIRPAPNVQSFFVLLTGLLSAFVLVAVGARVIFFLLTRSK